MVLRGHAILGHNVDVAKTRSKIHNTEIYQDKNVVIQVSFLISQTRSIHLKKKIY